MVCAWEASRFEDLAHVLKRTNVALEANTVAQAVWDSQGCVDFEPVFYSTEGSPGQKLI